MQIYTIGHSTLEFGEFAAALQSFGVQKLIDVRSIPGSRYVPQFNREQLADLLAGEGIAYAHFPKLGGRRKGRPGDFEAVSGWKNSSFRNYAAYTLTEDYEEGIAELLAEAQAQRVCIMCAESVPWRCHRLLVSNTLYQRGVKVTHIMGPGKAMAHEWNRYGARAVLRGSAVIYPAED